MCHATSCPPSGSPVSVYPVCFPALNKALRPACLPALTQSVPDRMRASLLNTFVVRSDGTKRRDGDKVPCQYLYRTVCLTVQLFSTRVDILDTRAVVKSPTDGPSWTSEASGSMRVVPGDHYVKSHWGSVRSVSIFILRLDGAV
jgi:hypothetical protein